MAPRKVTLLLMVLLVLGCTDAVNPEPSYEAPDMDALARQYLFLELSMGNIDAGHVDAYFGPDEIKADADEAALTVEQISESAAAMDIVLGNIPDDFGMRARTAGLRARLQSLQTRISVNKGELKSFDEESRLVFGTVAPTYDTAHFDAVLEKIDALLPGDGPLSERVDSFRHDFEVPEEKLAAVFEAAIAECRKRTLEHIQLTEGESFTVEYVSDKPWSGYNWYQGDSVSLIQVNTDFPILISRAVDLGCHEGYPGHHTFNALLEQNLVNTNGWLEYSLYPLFSPESVIAEGSGNYGIKLAFPGNSRLEFEKAVLFPLAGIDTSNADIFYELLALTAQLDFAGNEAARDYLNGDMSREDAISWLVKYSLNSPGRAEQRTRFFDAYRSYVINYNHGQTLVADFIERGDANENERWARFEKMLSTPVLPSDLE